MAGLAGVVAGTVSMAIGAYVSAKSVREFQESEEQRERYEIEYLPELERAELAEIYRQKGFTGAELERVLDRLTETPERWLRIMMTEELGLAGEVLNPSVAALVMGVAFAIGGIVPVSPYFLSEGATALTTAGGLTALGLFGVGCWRGTLANSSWLRKGLEMVGLGGLSFTLSYGIGWLLGVSI
jgi:VIT1/CCC1 family predicted Fe2+/Mn2+ transporter